MRIALVIPTLEAGGAEKVLSSMANYWASRGTSVDLITWDDAHGVSFFPLHENVRRIRLDVIRRGNHVTFPFKPAYIVM